MTRARTLLAAIALAGATVAVASARTDSVLSFNRTTSELVAVDAGTGEVSVLGTSVLPEDGGLVSLAAHGDELYGLVLGESARYLVRLDPQSGAVEFAVGLELNGETPLIDGIASDDKTLYAAYRSDPVAARFCADAIAAVDLEDGTLSPLVVYPQTDLCDLGVDIDAFAVGPMGGDFRIVNSLYFGPDSDLNAVEFVSAQLHPGTYVVINTPAEFTAGDFHAFVDLVWNDDGIYAIGAPFPEGGAVTLFHLDVSGGFIGSTPLIGPDGNYGPIARRIATDCLADLDDNGGVDSADLAVLLSAWGPCDDCPADFNGDNAVDSTDLSILLAAWGPC